MSRRNPNGKYTQSIQEKDICILLVNDDEICKNIVTDMLDHCRYEAFSYEKETDAVNMIHEKKDMTELILTNVHRTYAKRHGIIEHIEKIIKLQIILMSPDVDDKDVFTFGGKGLTVYFLKCLSANEMNNLWANALAREKNKKELLSGKLLVTENERSKRMRNDDDQHGNIEKKPRVVWTKEMHRKFLEAVAQLGEDKAFPKKIVELMNVPGLTRANVASHLQKHRFCMKRAREGFTSSSYDFTDNFGFKTLQQKFQRSHWNPFQTGSRNTTTTHFNSNYDILRSRSPQRLSLLKTIRLKPDHNFSVYGDETKNVLLRSIEDSRVRSNTSFAGFKFTRDGKSVVFGQNSHLASSASSVSSVQKQLSFPEMINDDPTLCPLFSDSFTPKQSSVAPLAESVSISSRLSSLTDLLASDEPVSAIMTQLQPPAAPPGFDWINQAAIQPPPAPPASVMTPPQSAGPQWTYWSEPEPEPPGFSPQQLLSENGANANFDIFNDFTSTYVPSELCNLGVLADDNGIDATAISDFDYLLFDDQELT